jgi:hypothetical protein
LGRSRGLCPDRSCSGSPRLSAAPHVLRTFAPCCEPLWRVNWSLQDQRDSVFR